MEKSHHLTASLYFGIASLEAFLNQQMRTHLSSRVSSDEIFDTLRKGKILEKVKAWPQEIIGKAPSVKPEVLELITLCNNIRADLTHPKSIGHDIYDRLFELEPMSVVDAVAQYIVSFHEAQGSRYPYWVFGWNYLNPRQDKHEIVLIHEQQFCHSLAALGFNVPSWGYEQSEVWKDKYLVTLGGYSELRDALKYAVGCEPKSERFPYQPKLCRRWWLPGHQKTCGNVTKASLNAAN